jgi:hypothetical protein
MNKILKIIIFSCILPLFIILVALGLLGLLELFSWWLVIGLILITFSIIIFSKKFESGKMILRSTALVLGKAILESAVMVLGVIILLWAIGYTLASPEWGFTVEKITKQEITINRLFQSPVGQSLISLTENVLCPSEELTNCEDWCIREELALCPTGININTTIQNIKAKNKEQKDTIYHLDYTASIAEVPIDSSQEIKAYTPDGQSMQTTECQFQSNQNTVVKQEYSVRGDDKFCNCGIYLERYIVIDSQQNVICQIYLHTNLIAPGSGNCGCY